MSLENDHYKCGIWNPQGFLSSFSHWHVRGFLSKLTALKAEVMMSWCLMSSDVSWHIRDKLWPMPKHGSINLLLGTGRRGGRGYGGGREREIIYLSLHCHHQNDSCIKVGSDESRFNVSVGSDGQSHRTVSTNHNLSEEKGEPKRYRTEVLRLPA